MTERRGREGMDGGDARDVHGKAGCTELRQHLMTFLDGECTFAVSQSMTWHLRECPPCMDRAAFERRVRTRIAVCCRDHAPPELLQRILRALDDG